SGEARTAPRGVVLSVPDVAGEAEGVGGGVRADVDPALQPVRRAEHDQVVADLGAARGHEARFRRLLQDAEGIAVRVVDRVEADTSAVRTGEGNRRAAVDEDVAFDADV